MSLTDVIYRALAIASLLACGSSPPEPSHAVAPLALPLDAGGHLAELEGPARVKLIALDWSNVHAANDAEALAVWNQIAPTGADWEAKLQEIPSDQPIARALAIALLHEGNFTCVPATPAIDCVKRPVDIEPPVESATLRDPCLRRMLALWAIDQLDDTDLPAVHDALRAIAALPPPESQLVASAIKEVPETDQAGRLEMLAIAWHAGQHELVDGMLNALDEPHMIEAATKLHIDGALEVLSAEGYRAIYLGAVTDEQMAAPARIEAMTDLAVADTASGTDHLTAATHAALVAATKAPDCTVAASAARILDQHGDHTHVPANPSDHTTAAMLRTMCVLASFELLQRADETSPLRGYIPARGLELVKIVYDPYNEVDTDGDGDPHTERTIDLIARGEVVVPEIEEMVRAFRRCTGTICRTEDHEFRFTFKPGPTSALLLWRLEVADRPPCNDKQAIPTP